MSTFYQPELSLDAPTLPPDESRHCVKVLRQQVGDSLLVVDGRGMFYEGVITDANPKRCAFDIVRSWAEPVRPYSIHLAIAPTKNLDRMEWLVEKAVEIGIDQLSFIRCEHSERRVLKTERLMKKAVAAMKQSGRATMPILGELQRMEPWLEGSGELTTDQRFIAYVDPANPTHLSHAAQPNGSYTVLVGPEGGFSKREVEKAQAAGYQPVSLGPARLRTETAGLVVCTALNLVNC